MTPFFYIWVNINIREHNRVPKNQNSWGSWGLPRPPGKYQDPKTPVHKGLKNKPPNFLLLKVSTNQSFWKTDL